MSVTLNGTQVTGGGGALDLESVPTIINKNAQYNVTKTVGPLEITLKQRGIFSMLELKIKAGYGQNGVKKNIDYLELIKALKELGIHTVEASNPFYFILNFKAINYIHYINIGFGYILPEYTLVKDNSINLNTHSSGITFGKIFGIDLDNIYNNGGTTCKIIGYWTDDDKY